MALVNITLEFNSLNDFIQAGDTVYYSHTFSSLGGFDQTAASNTRRLGLITNISGSFIDVQYDNTTTTPPAIAPMVVPVAIDAELPTKSPTKAPVPPPIAAPV